MDGWIVIPREYEPVKNVLNIDKYKSFFDSVKQWPENIRIDVCSTITDVKKMVNTHILVIENTKNEKLFKPYFERLLKVYEKMNEENVQGLLNQKGY